MMRVQPRTNTTFLPESETPNAQVIVYICPTRGCGNYYASNNFKPSDSSLDEMQYQRGEKGQLLPTRTRRECPDCYVRIGKHVPREPFVVLSGLPLGKVLEAIEKRKVKGGNGDRGSTQ